MLTWELFTKIAINFKCLDCNCNFVLTANRPCQIWAILNRSRLVWEQGKLQILFHVCSTQVSHHLHVSFCRWKFFLERSHSRNCHSVRVWVDFDTLTKPVFKKYCFACYPGTLNHFADNIRPQDFQFYLIGPLFLTGSFFQYLWSIRTWRYKTVAMATQIKLLQFIEHYTIWVVKYLRGCK